MKNVSQLLMFAAILCSAAKSTGHAQNIAWQTIFNEDTISVRGRIMVSIRGTQNGDYICTAFTNDIPINNNLFLIDSAGGVRWRKDILPSTTPVTIPEIFPHFTFQNDEGGFSFIGNALTSSLSLYGQFMIQKLDSNGNPGWNSFNKNKMNTVYCDYNSPVTQTHQKGFAFLDAFAASDSTDGDLYFTTCDQNCARLAETLRFRSGRYELKPYSIEQSQNGDFVIACGFRDNSYQTELPGAYLLRLDSLGKKIWDTSFVAPGVYPCKACVTPDNDMLILLNVKGTDTAGNPAAWLELVRMDKLGKVLWHNVYKSDTRQILSGSCIRMAQDSVILIGGYAGEFNTGQATENYSTYDMYILSLHSSGLKRWDKTIDLAGQGDFLSDIYPAQDGSIILAGSVYISARSRSYYIARLTNRTAAVEQPITQRNHLQIAVAPNPVTSSYMTITCTVPNPSATELRIHDILGRLVYSQRTGNTEPGVCNMLIPVNTLPNGVYTVQLQTRDQNISASVIIAR